MVGIHTRIRKRNDMYKTKADLKVGLYDMPGPTGPGLHFEL